MLHIFKKTNLIPEAPKANDGNEKFFATKYGRLLPSIRSSITLTRFGGVVFTINFKPKFRLRLKLKKMWSFFFAGVHHRLKWHQVGSGAGWFNGQPPWTQTQKPRPLGSRHALFSIQR